MLEDADQETPDFLDVLLEFTDFAVVFRYEAFPDLEGDIDRRGCIDRIGRLLRHVEQILTQSNSQ